ncbi:MAG: Rieske 2Fe-2S domain-containing protein [Bdellovibrionota bacterium]
MSVPSPHKIRIASTSDVEVGKGKAIMIKGKEIALFRTDQGYFACENSCLHQGAPLDQGDLDGCFVSCPWHAWKFDLRSGEFVSDPAFSIKTYALEIQDQDIYLIWS